MRGSRAVSGEEADDGGVRGKHSRRSARRRADDRQAERLEPWANRPASWNSSASCRRTARRSSAFSDWDEFHLHFPDEQAARSRARAAWIAAFRSATPARCIAGHGLRLPDQQPDPGVERPGLSRPLAARRSTGCTRPTTSPSSPAGSAPRPARAPACWASIEPPVTIKSIECAIVDQGFEEGWIVPEPPAQAHRQEGGGRRLRPGRAGLRRPAQPGRPPGHRLRARRPHRRPADVRHPEHEARQERRRSAASS